MNLGEARRAIREGTATEEHREYLREYFARYSRRKIQVVVTEEEAERFREHARRKGSTLSAWAAHELRRSLAGERVRQSDHERVLSRVAFLAQERDVYRAETARQVLEMEGLRKELERCKEELEKSRQSLVELAREALRGKQP